MPFQFQTSAATSGSTTIVTGFSTASLLFSAATLSGGAQLASATGSIPQRITVATETYITGTANGRHGIAFDPDGVHFWLSDSNAHQLKRYRLSDGVIDYAITGSTTDPTKNTMTAGPSTLKVGYGNRLWFVTEGTHTVGFIDVSTATPSCEIFSGSSLLSNTVDVCEHLPGRILVRYGGATAASTYFEYSYSGTGSVNTNAYTGKQIIEGTTFWTAVPDISGNVYTANNTGVIHKRSSTTLTASANNTPISANVVSLPGYSSVRRELVYYPTAAKLFAKGVSENDWDQIDVTTMTIDGRAYPDTEFGNPMSLIASSYERSPIAYSLDGTKQVHVTYEAEANATTFAHVRTLTLGKQRSRWTFALGANAHVKLISVVGQVANMIGSVANMPSNTWLNSEYDLRKTKFYYSLDGGTTRIEFKQGDFLNVAVTSAQTLTVDAEFQKTPLLNYGVDPWIGDSTTQGRAGFILYTLD